MNRIRKKNNKYEVLITPFKLYSASFELMQGNWSDDNLSGYFIKKFNNLQDAKRLSNKYPNLDWYNMVLMYKYEYYQKKRILEEYIDKNTILESKLLNPSEAKELMFNRVEKLNNNFRLSKNFNDILSFNIINSNWNSLLLLNNLLSMDIRLKITKSIYNESSIILIGKTDLGTTYQILLTRL
jgi:phosphomevalonate kinase